MRKRPIPHGPYSRVTAAVLRRQWAERLVVAARPLRKEHSAQVLLPRVVRQQTRVQRCIREIIPRGLQGAVQEEDRGERDDYIRGRRRCCSRSGIVYSWIGEKLSSSLE